MHPARAFTLIEMVVALGVILLLAGLTLSVATSVIGHSEATRTEATLQLLDSAVKEWEATADRKLRWWQYGDNARSKAQADVHSDTREVLIITEILDVITRTRSATDVIARIDPELVFWYEDDSAGWLDHPAAKSQVKERFIGSITVLDAWGKPIYATHPGRPWVESDAEEPYPLLRDPDGTIRTINEHRYGVAPNRQVVFVSAGPDGYFGFTSEFPHLSGPQQQEAAARARRDNLYSTPVSFAPGSY